MNSWAGPCASSPCNTCDSASHHAACVADTPFVHSHSRAWSRHQVPCRCCLLRPVTPHAVAEPSRACGLTAQARPTSSASSSLHCSMPPMPACLGSSCSNCGVATARLGRCQLGRTKARRCRRRPRRLSRTSYTAASGLNMDLRMQCAACYLNHFPCFRPDFQEILLFTCLACACARHLLELLHGPWVFVSFARGACKKRMSGQRVLYDGRGRGGGFAAWLTPFARALRIHRLLGSSDSAQCEP